MSRARLGALLAVVSLTGCAPPGGSQNAPADVTPRPRATAPADPEAMLVVDLRSAAASQYGPSAADVATSVLARRLRERVPELEASACLERAARAWAEAMEGLDAEPELGFAEFVLHWAGCPDPSAMVATTLVRGDGLAALADHLRDTVRAGPWTHVGAAATSSGSGDRRRWTAFLTTRKVGLQAVPARVEPGTTLPLAFRVLGDLAAVELLVTRPDGSVSEYEVGRSGPWAVASVPVPAASGRLWIELLGYGSAGPEVVALFPVQVGRQPPRVWAGPRRPDESDLVTDADAEALAERLIRDTRARFGLPPLQVDPEVSRVARSHSREMARTGQLAHLSPTSGAVGHRLRTAGITFRHAAENIAQAPSIAEAHEGLLRSPGHRAALLDAQATHVGVGVATVDRPDAGRVRYLTQVFVERRRPLPPQELTAAVAAHLADLRHQHGVAALERSEVLDRIAFRVAQGFALDRLDADRAKTLVARELRAAGLDSGSWRMCLGEPYEAREIRLPTDVVTALDGVLGIAAARDPRQPEDRPASCVVLLVRGAHST